MNKAMTLEEIKEYLQNTIEFWRKTDLYTREIRECYIDAYQSVYCTIFGEPFQEE